MVDAKRTSRIIWIVRYGNAVMSDLVRIDQGMVKACTKVQSFIYNQNVSRTVAGSISGCSRGNWYIRDRIEGFMESIHIALLAGCAKQLPIYATAYGIGTSIKFILSGSTLYGCDLSHISGTCSFGSTSRGPRTRFYSRDFHICLE